ncbi:hypothetical protein F2Y36_07860 [Bacteroides caccae]|uniref:Peptidase M60 domain-containing protein n=1 Tax=Bacteroides caccae TaxID=47678 RepID=A0A6L3KWN7_9BACE|nr:M60 family metallopeptidase [Bacteroides caccae]KAA5444865.1 hypothetical protein F2Y45_08720 [Bacteroides caccae]KAA5464148.1 hypothetical protein F2Y36_07860 [Bacteroides caccae]MDU3579805.1 M60 family metallopeptidase [Bacteroides caccae]MDU3629060.1 M60 family metallopeptidase [Bacteroides caccae]MDU3671946.1 M60 family metallopeptidase [Bacteroides caccae]
MKILNRIPLYLSLGALFACSDEETVSASIQPAEQTFVFAQAGGAAETTVASTVEWRVSTPKEATEWCKASRLADVLRISVNENPDSDERSVTLSLYSDGVTVPVKVEQLGTNPAIKADRTELNVAGTALEGSVKVTANIDYTVVPNDEWIAVKPEPETRGILQTKEVVFAFERNNTGKKRTGSVTFEPVKDEHKKLAVTLQVVQNFSSMDAGDISDKQIKIVNAEANQQEKSQEWKKQDIMASCDGDMSTFYHSPWNSGTTTFPVVLTYHLEEASDVDYLMYTPRQESDNGAWGKIDVEFATGRTEDFVDKESFDLKEQPKDARKVEFAKTHSGVTSVRITIRSGKGSLVTCAELGVYQKNLVVAEELKRIFADELCTTLNAGIGEEQIKEIKSPFLKDLATILYKGGYDEYDKEFRVQEYLPYRPVNDLSKELKTSGYNPFENPTGLFFKPGDDIVIFVPEELNGEHVSLLLYDFHNKSLGEQRSTENFPLCPGINVFKTQQGGLAYFSYYTMNYKTAAPIRAHIASGQVNGYFEKGKHDVANWQTVINKAEYGHFDLKGEKVNMCFPVSVEGGLRQYCKNPEKLIDIYDESIGKEQEMMGIEKYGRTFTNHMFIRTVPYSPGAAAYADEWGVGIYNKSTEHFNDEVCRYKALWANAHEFGHVNQVRPDLKWHGTTEVTNNCYAICIRHELMPWWEKFEDESHNDGRGKSVAGGLLNKYINDKVLPHATTGSIAPWLEEGDAFLKLTPIWQLLCYYRYAEPEHKDWWADIIERMRKKSTPDNKPDGELQIEFMKMACDVLDTDLSEFFELAGMLKPCELIVNDYGKKTVKITEAQCRDAKTYMQQRYTKPQAMLHYMSANAIRIFKEKVAVQGTYNQGVNRQGNIVTVQHSVWKNAVAFETYAGEKVTQVAIMGTGVANSTGQLDIKQLPLSEKAYTEVYYPAKSTAIYAVSWDGKRTLVYGDSNGVEKK